MHACMGLLCVLLTGAEHTEADTFHLNLHRSVLLAMSNGRPPTKVLCTGHSLGAGLASICGVWASAQWVGADIRVVTFGSPATGNEQWAEVRTGRSARTRSMQRVRNPRCGFVACRRALGVRRTGGSMHAAASRGVCSGAECLKPEADWMGLTRSPPVDEACVAAALRA